MMKKTFLAVCIACVSTFAANAEGYQVNTLSAKQNGMGHVGVGMKLGAESMIFNPAGMAFSDRTFEFSGSFTGIKSSVRAELDGYGTFESSNKVSTPLAFSAAFKVYDNLQVGVTFFTPYGSSITWGDNWPGAVLNQQVDLKAFTIQPTVAWRILPNFSIGAGLNLAWGNVDLHKGLIPASPMFGGLVPCSAALNGTADLAMGFNVGAMWDINKQWTVGVDFRSEMKMKVQAGNTTVSYASEQIQAMLENQVGLINEANFSAEMPLPAILQAGVSYKPIDRLTLAFDAQLTFWKAYKSLDISFDLPQVLKDKFDQHIVKDYHNAWAFHLGAQYALTNRFDVRAGMMIDTTPVNTNYYNPETPGMTKIESTCGLSFRPVEQLSIDLSVMYVAGLGNDNVECPYNNMLTGQVEYLRGNYKLHAWVPSIGLNFHF